MGRGGLEARARNSYGVLYHRFHQRLLGNPPFCFVNVVLIYLFTEASYLEHVHFIMALYSLPAILRVLQVGINDFYFPTCFQTG